MFKKKNKVEVQLENPGTIISDTVTLSGMKMKGTESVRIDGLFEGDIELEGTLVLGETGHITGNIKVTHFLVAGEVNGNIECFGQLRFASTAKVNGDIQANSLVVDDGAKLTGKYQVHGNIESTDDTSWDRKGDKEDENLSQI